MSQADEVRSNSDTFHEPEPAAALNVTTAAREWIAATLSRSWRARMQRLTWHILSPGSQEDSPDLLIAAARAFLALTSLLAIWLDSTEPARLASVARGLLLLYCVYSAAVFVFEKKARSSVRYGVIVHIRDIVWAAAITSVTEGPNSPFFLFFLFVVMAAAYRWNIRRVMWTAASLIGVLAAQAAILRISVVHSFVGTDYDTNRVIMRAAYLLVGSVVIGYIASNEKRLIREAAFVGSVVSLPLAERGLKRSAQMVLCEIARFFCVPKAAMLIRIHGGSTYLLECTAGDTEKDWTDLSPAEVEPWLFSVAANCAWVVRNAAATNLLDRTARWRSRKSRGEVQLPLRFVETNRFKDLLLANLVMADDWSGRIFLFDPQPQSDPRSALDLLDRIVRQVTPAVHNVYLLKRIR